MQNHAVYYPISLKLNNVLFGGASYTRKVANDDLMLQLMGTTLFFDHDNHPAYAIEKRVYHLRQRINRNQNQRLSAYQVFQIYIDAADIMVECQRYKDARDICYSFIQWLTKHVANENTELNLQFEILTWLQLVKVDRIEKNYCDAFQKIKLINARCPNKVLFNVFLETIKLLFVTAQFNVVAEMIEGRIDHYSNPEQTVIAEALAISYAMQQNKQKAQQTLNQIPIPITTVDKVMLDWRKLEVSQQSHHAMKIQLNATSQMMHELLVIHDMPCKNLYFVLHLAQWLYAFGDHISACRLLDVVLEQADSIDDDKLKAHSLVRLYSWRQDVDARQSIEDRLIHHYHHTYYFAERELMLEAFQELKYVEVKKPPYYLDLLLDDLVINVHLFK